MGRGAHPGRRSSVVGGRLGQLRSWRDRLAWVLETVRRGAQTARVAAINELKALVVTAPVDLRDQLRGLNTAALVTKTHKFRPGQPTSGSRSEHTATKMAMRSLARRIRTLTTEIAELKTPIARSTY